jgi:transcriptional regulator with XRE-family HTH domain
MLHEDVRLARIEHGLSQLRLSQLAGVPRSQLRKFESGGNITLDTLRKILRQLPNLKSARLDAVELQLEQTDVGALRVQLTELAATATRVLGLLDGAQAHAPAGATRFEGGLEIPATLEERLRALEESIEERRVTEHEV